ncbi:hypothetical protein KO164_3061 [Thalassospira sp. KO164]|nr:hypothetical protein KO164_3061 [Thalassospira sp. KO164]
MFSSIAPEKVSIPSAETALPGRAEKLQVADRHAVTGNPMTGPFPDNLETAVFGMGCFWGRSVFSGNRMASLPQQQVTRVATLKTPHIARFAAA